MSRMTKFLHQKCMVEIYKRDEDNNPERNRFGEIVYETPTERKCRREKIVKDVKTINGSIVQATSRYFLDEKLEIMADYRIDGHVVLTAEEYANEIGKIEGYEVYV